MERQEFIKTCGLVCLGGTALSVLLESCGSTAYFAQNMVVNDQVVIKKTEFIAVKKGLQEQRRFVMVKSSKLQMPICIYKHSETDYTALYTECTHKGCEVKPNDNFIACPCHGSEYTNRGVVQNPPAEKNLRQFKITTDNENIYVQV